jgi:hypothetical protein
MPKLKINVHGATLILKHEVSGPDSARPSPNLSCQWLPTLQQHIFRCFIRMTVADVLRAASVHADGCHLFEYDDISE